MTRSLVGAFVLCLALWMPGTVLARADVSEDAVAFVSDRGSEMLRILDLPKGSDRRDRFENWLDQVLDLETVGTLALGPYQTRASEEQLAAYRDAFRDYIVATYEARFDAFAGYTFEVGRTRPVGETDVLVRATIIDPAGRRTPVEFRVRQSDGRLQVIDVAVEGISMLRTQRDEFTAVLQRHGMDGLIARLREQTSRASN